MDDDWKEDEVLKRLQSIDHKLSLEIELLEQLIALLGQTPQQTYPATTAIKVDVS
jgi:hypothetical protein